MSAFAEVLVDLISNRVNRPFHYRIPERFNDAVKPGMRVTVPLGRKIYQGYVLRLLDHTDIAPLKDIVNVLDEQPLLSREQIALIHWISLRYYCRPIDALHAMIPVSYRQGGNINDKKIIVTTGVKPEDLKRAPLQREALETLITRGALPRRALIQCGVKSATIRNLEKKGLITYIEDPGTAIKTDEIRPVASPHQLSSEQEISLNVIKDALSSGKKKGILLHGVTASGKTEIYMRSVQHCLALGRTALIMVPEIALTPQMIKHFEIRFPGLLAVLHSRLTLAEKRKQWQLIIKGQTPVVLGARSSVFAPLQKLGLIIIDEEHENTYKQEESPRYHARDVAWWRVRYNKALMLLGSATPSLESYHRALTGEITLLEMHSRVTSNRLPPVEIVDMRQEIKENNRSIFSRLLLEELQSTIDRGEQVLLFINRRGFAGFVLCRECGYVIRCPSCDVSLTLHLDCGLMRCHYCAHQEKVPEICPDCRGHKIKFFSAGTQRVEEEVRKLYPELPLIRMDSDTTTGRKAHDDYYRQFLAQKARVLIGTQMVAKGFDFPGVTLVGVVAADTSLNLPDFRSPERTFQLLTQVSGRTSRGPQGGKVIVQTYHPAHYSILAAAEHDFQKFAETELALRKQLDYPPFGSLIRFLFRGTDEEVVLKAADWFTEHLKSVTPDYTILGPAPASLYRIKDNYRVQLMLKGTSLLHLAPRIKKVVFLYHSHKPEWPAVLSVDFNPQVVL